VKNRWKAQNITKKLVEEKRSRHQMSENYHRIIEQFGLEVTLEVL